MILRTEGTPFGACLICNDFFVEMAAKKGTARHPSCRNMGRELYELPARF